MTRMLIVGLVLTISGASPPRDRIHATFDELLGMYVEGERVDYARIREEELGSLQEYLRRLDSHDVQRLGRDDQLAYHINLYNATMIHEVIQRRDRDPAWRPDADDFAVFKEPTVTMGGRKLSLNDLEHEIIRPRFKDPRVHAALVCAARSCPPLIPRAHRAEDLDEILDANMKRFVLDRSRNPIDDARKELKLSKIFEWYADDFGGKDKLAEYVGTIAEKDYSGYSVTFVEYSWELNDVRP